MLGLAPKLLTALKGAGLTQPTPIQNQAIPLALEGHDILGLAQTGTGKTLAFGLPLIDHLLAEPGKPLPKTAKALILAPTRELVNQIAESLRVLTAGTKLRVATVVGGQSIGKQIAMLFRGTDILVATPGRLIDLMDRGAVDLSTVRHLVLDEADQMLDLGFIHALRKIAPRLGSPRQTMLFSATMPKQMEELSQGLGDRNVHWNIGASEVAEISLFYFFDNNVPHDFGKIVFLHKSVKVYLWQFFNYKPNHTTMFGDLMGNMKEQQKEMRKKLAEFRVQADAGNGAVKVTANANRELIDIQFDKDKLDWEDTEMVQDLIIAAVNQVLEQAAAKEAEEAQNIMKNMLPPGMGDLGNLFG